MICCVSDDSSKYEKYKETAAAFSIEGGIAGIAVDTNGNYTDLDGQQWICDEIVKYADGSGEYIKRLEKIVLDGSEDEGWANASASDSYRKTTSIVANSIKRSSNNNEVANMLCTQFVKKNINQTYQNDKPSWRNRINIIS
jgi:monoamine oxidase